MLLKFLSLAFVNLSTNSYPLLIQIKKIHTILEDFIVLTLRALSLSRTNKQTNKTIYSDIDIKAPGLHTIQYNNIYKTVVIMVLIMKTTKIIYIVDRVHYMER